MASSQDENRCDLHRESLIALPLLPSNNGNELILFDPQWLALQRNMYGPYKIAKTKLLIEERYKWEALITDGSRYASLLTSDDVETTNLPINLIDILGHRISVMLWQSLIIRLGGANAVLGGVIYIEDIN